MGNEIENVYIGLPLELKDKVLWVSDDYRTNSLSLTPGGCDVVVEYHNGNVYGYTRIKFPSRYIPTFFNNEVKNSYSDYDSLDQEKQLEVIKSEISTIYARFYIEKTQKTETYNKIWDSSESDDIPWENLKKFDYTKANKLEYLKGNRV
jgi:hypothetical protein